MTQNLLYIILTPEQTCLGVFLFPKKPYIYGIILYMNKYLYAEISPLIKLPKALGSFDYLIPQELQDHINPGDLVEIPYRSKKIHGIVIKAKNNPFRKNIAIKPIIKKVSQDFLASYHLELALWMSRYYYQSPSLIFRSILPTIPKRIKENIIDTKRLEVKISTKESSPEYKKILYVGEEKFSDYADIINLHIKNNKQILILVPEISSIQYYAKEYEKYFPKEIISLVNQDSAKSKVLHTWQKIAKNEVKIIIGTRRVIFSPCKNLGLIIMHNEDDISFKQWDQNPRYHARDVALKIAELTSAQIILTSHSPKTTTYAKKFKDFHLIVSFPKENSVRVIDMRDEIKNKQYSIISSHLHEKISSLKGQAILFVNKKGSSSFVLCKECGYVPKCQVCGLAYSFYDTSEKNLRCNNCAISTNLEKKCNQCKGIIFKFVGSGTQKISNVLAEQFPNMSVARLDGDTDEKESTQIIKNFISGDTQILIGTQAIFNSLPPNMKVDLCAIVSADTFLSIPDYLASEKTFSMIINAMFYGKHSVIQTYNPQNFSIRCASLYDYEKFYNGELQSRKKFFYPPFSRLIKIISQDDSSQKAEKSSYKIFHEIQKKIRERVDDIEVLGPIPSSTVMTRGRYRWVVILKIKNNKTQIQDIMDTVPDSALIDVDPIILV